MNKIVKYQPNLYLLQNTVVDLNLVNHLSVEKEVIVLEERSPTSFSFWNLIFFSSYDADRGWIIKETGRYYVWIKTQRNQINLQLYYDTQKEAEKNYKKILKLSKVKVYK